MTLSCPLTFPVKLMQKAPLCRFTIPKQEAWSLNLFRANPEGEKVKRIWAEKGKKSSPPNPRRGVRYSGLQAKFH
jgi:hypothetical protein